jgi:hypothetical protein
VGEGITTGRGSLGVGDESDERGCDEWLVDPIEPPISIEPGITDERR